MDKNTDKYDNTILKNSIRVVVILIVVFTIIYSDRTPKSSSSSNYGLSGTNVSSESSGLNAATISDMPQDSSSPPENGTVSESSTQSASSNVGSNKLRLLISNSRIHSGNLILVDENNPCKSDGNNYTELANEANSFYHIGEVGLLLNRDVIPQLNKMMHAFYSAKNNSSLTVTGGYISYDKQFELYGGSNHNYSITDNVIEKPGFSEHQIGNTFDLCILDDTTQNLTQYAPYSDYEWINDNCYKYGFIVSYESDKTDITGKEYQPWHFRYVGVAHATIMKYNNFCLKEYIEYVRKFTYSKQHLTLTDPDMNNWEIYYVPADLKNVDDETEIVVPRNSEYFISGDNSKGFIVSVKL